MVGECPLNLNLPFHHTQKGRLFFKKTLSHSSKIDFLTFTFMVLYYLSVLTTV